MLGEFRILYFPHKNKTIFLSKPVQCEPLLVELTIVVHYSVRDADVFFYRSRYLKTYKNAG